MPVKVGKVTKVSYNICDIPVEGDNRDEVSSLITQDLVFRKASEAGISDPAVEPGRTRMKIDKKTGRITKIYRIIGE